MDAKAESEMFVKDKNIGKGEAGKIIKLKANDTTLVTVNTSLNISAINNLFAELMLQDSTLIKLNCIFTVKKLFLNFTLSENIDYYFHIQNELNKILQKKIKTDKIVEITKITPKSFALDESTLNVEIKFNNSFPISYKITDLYFDILLDKSNDIIGNLKIDKEIEINANESKNINFIIKINNPSFFNSIGNFIFGGKKYVLLKGTTIVQLGASKFEIPIEQKQSIIPKL